MSLGNAMVLPLPAAVESGRGGDTVTITAAGAAPPGLAIAGLCWVWVHGLLQIYIDVGQSRAAKEDARRAATAALAGVITLVLRNMAERAAREQGILEAVG